MSFQPVDTRLIEFTCPHCSHQCGCLLGELRSKKETFCSGCLRVFEIDTTYLDRDIETAITKFVRQLQSL